MKRVKENHNENEAGPRFHYKEAGKPRKTIDAMRKMMISK
jgi:hypothetical protein